MDSKVLKSKLTALEKKAVLKKQFALASAANYLMTDETNLDKQINLLGALHEVGYLQNTFLPYWTLFRSDEQSWIKQCLLRLSTQDNDHDYWAVAALLGCDGKVVVEQALSMGFKSIAVYYYCRFDNPDVHMHTLYANGMGKVLHPIIEVGYDSKTMKIVDVGRARALVLDNESWEPGQFIGNGHLSMSLQAKLPHGAWRTVSTPFLMKETFLIQYP